jgi:DNA primase
VPPALTTLVGQLAVGPLPEKNDQIERYALGITASLLDREFLRKKADLLSTLQRTSAEADPVGYRELQERLVEIERERRLLREE